MQDIHLIFIKSSWMYNLKHQKWAEKKPKNINPICESTVDLSAVSAEIPNCEILDLIFCSANLTGDKEKNNSSLSSLTLMTVSYDYDIYHRILTHPILLSLSLSDLAHTWFKATLKPHFLIFYVVL